jgi:hypothetical protein
MPRIVNRELLCTKENNQAMQKQTRCPTTDEGFKKKM